MPAKQIEPVNDLESVPLRPVRPPDEKPDGAIHVTAARPSNRGDLA